MKVVVDANVFVSAGLKFRSTPASALRLIEANATLLKTDAIDRQVSDVLRRPEIARLTPVPTRNWLLALLANAEAVTVTRSIVACRDPTDDKYLEAAVSGHADHIVTGDHDLLALHPYEGISIITPAIFLRIASHGIARP